MDQRLAEIRQVHPSLADRLERVKAPRYACYDKSGEGAARLLFSEVPVGCPVAVHIIGLGDLSFYKPACEWLSRTPGAKVLVHETDLELLYGTLEKGDLEGVLAHPSMLLVSFTEEEWDGEEGRYLASSLLYQKVAMYPPITFACDNRKHSWLRAQLMQNFGKERYASEQMRGAKEASLNLLENLFRLPEGYDAGKMIGKFKGVPMVFCGAAPSIKDAEEFLRSVRERALIVTGSTGVNALQEMGIKPDAIILLDPTRNLFSKFADYYNFEVPIFFATRTAHESLQYYSAPFIYTCRGSLGVSYLIENSLGLGIPPAALDDSYGYGCSVTSVSAVLANALGCSEVYFTGVDLAYEEGKPRYSVAKSQHPLVAQHEGSAPPIMEGYQMCRANSPVKYTVTVEFRQEIRWFEKFTKAYPSFPVTVASPIAGEVSGLKVVSFAEKLREWHVQPDLKVRLQEAIAASSTSYITREKLLNELKRAKRNFEQGWQSLESALRRFRLKDTPVEQLQHALEQFVQSDFFRGNYQYKMVSLRRGILGTKRFWQRDLSVVEEQVASYLKMILRDWICLTRVLHQQTSNSAAVAEAPPVKEEDFAFVSGRLRSSIPDCSGTIRLYHPNGRLKREVTLIEGKREGVERCFAEDGTLLLEAFFKEDQLLEGGFYRELYE